MRTGIVGGQQRVDRNEWADIEIRLPPQLSANFEKVPVQLFENALESQEGFIALFVIDEKVFSAERCHIAVARSPQRGDLFDATANVCFMRDAMLGNECVDGCGDRFRTVRGFGW